MAGISGLRSDGNFVLLSMRTELYRGELKSSLNGLESNSLNSEISSSLLNTLPKQVWKNLWAPISRSLQSCVMWLIFHLNNKARQFEHSLLKSGELVLCFHLFFFLSYYPAHYRYITISWTKLIICPNHYRSTISYLKLLGRDVYWNSEFSDF